MHELISVSLVYCIADIQANPLAYLSICCVGFSSVITLDVATATPSEIRLAYEQIFCVVLPDANDTVH